MNYKYSLDRTSKKFQCPNCNKKTFVRYYDNESNTYLKSNLGRCDRESKCGYHLPPNGNKSLVEKFSTPVIPPKATYHDSNLVIRHGRGFGDNHFINFLLLHFTKDVIQNVIRKYLLGTSNHWPGSVIFWQIDQNAKIRAGKTMLYDKNTGSRVKKPFPRITWMHKIIGEKNFVLRQCLFGLHILPEYEGTVINIVESEKTAIIMSMILPEYLWLATGSKSNLKESMLYAIKDYTILVYPDKTEYSNWNEKVLVLQQKGFTISTSSLLENLDLQDGSDLVDLMFKYKSKQKAVDPISSFSSRKQLMNYFKNKNIHFALLISELELI